MCSSDLGCGPSRRAGPTPQEADLGGDLVATVGERTIGRALVERVAAEQGLSPKQALDALVRDALLASAYSRSPGHLHAVRAARRSALAREMLQELRREAEAQGPPTDAEVQERTAKQWVDLDRPEATVTQHALVRVTSSEQEGAALAVAKAIRNAVASASSADDFDRLARAVPSGGLEVILERLPAVTADGRVVKLDDLSRGPSALEAAYASAAASLTGAGAVSEPVRSSWASTSYEPSSDSPRCTCRSNSDGRCSLPSCWPTEPAWPTGNSSRRRAPRQRRSSIAPSNSSRTVLPVSLARDREAFRRA